MIKEYMLYSIKGINLLPTLLLGIIIFYWLLTIIGVVSSDSLDIKFGLDDLDLDLDVDGDGDFDVDTSNLFVKILDYGNFGLIPFMVYLSIIVIVLWALSMLSYYLRINPNATLGVFLFFINIIISFFTTKIITLPLIPFFQGLEINTKFEPLGKEGVLTTDLEPDRLGTLLLKGEKGKILLINVICKKENLKKGDIAFVIEKLSNRDVYLVSHKNSHE